MKRIDTATKAIDLFGAGKHGYKDGDKALGIPATALNASVFNALQEEMATVIEATGAALNGADNTQLYTAITGLLSGSLDYKASCRIATTANIATLTGLGVIDGVTPVAGDRVLVKDQASAAQNGIYLAAAEAWTRAIDADTGAEFNSGAVVSVEEGTVNADSIWMMTNNGTVTIGTTSLVFLRVSSQSIPSIFSISASVAASALTATLSPVASLDFRHPTLATGTANNRTVPTAISIVVPSGATLGTTSATPFRLMLLAIDNAGTVELAVVNQDGGNFLDETGVITTITLSAAADSANIIYSTTGRASVPYRIVGIIDQTQATAGEWVTAPSKVGMAKSQGQIGQVVTAQTSAVSTTTNPMPSDNTIPQITEGAQFLTASITPTNEKSLITVQVKLNVASGGSQPTVALFKNGAANAVSAVNAYPGAVAICMPTDLSYQCVAGSLSAITFAVRAGEHAANAMTVNGASGVGLFGGVMFSSITITEYLP